MQGTSGESKSNVEKKNMKKLPSAKEMVAHYESKGMDTQEASLKVIDDLQNLLLKVVVVNNNTKKKNSNSDEVLKRMESKLDSKPGYPQSIAIGFLSGGVAASVAHIWNSVRSSTRPLVRLHKFKAEIMGRGVSSGGGQSSLDYLFGSGDEPKPSKGNAEAPAPAPASQVHAAGTTEPTPKPAAAVTPPDIAKQVPAGVQSSKLNNYIRADGQNTGNFLTDRPSTKVHAAPGGGSSLGYLFGDGSK
ncbi:SPIRAL1-like protein 1 [Tanacetum coccineum]